jgi:hypothetical protein
MWRLYSVSGAQVHDLHVCLHETVPRTPVLLLADFDYRQSMCPGEPGAWYALLPLEQVYAFDPVPQARPPLVCLPLPPHHPQSSTACGPEPQYQFVSGGQALCGEASLTFRLGMFGQADLHIIRRTTSSERATAALLGCLSASTIQATCCACR